MLKIRALTGVCAATAIMFAVGAASVAPASAANNIKPFGIQETLDDYVTGAPVTGYTVSNLSPSFDPVPYPVAGRLYEAGVTVDALGGPVVPLIPLFNARAESGQNYRVLEVSTPQGLSGAPLPPGGSATGKLYFDVVGDVPNSVVYNDGVQDLLVWIATSEPAKPEGAPGGGGSSTINGGSSGGGANSGSADLGPFGGSGTNDSTGGGGLGDEITGSDAGGGGLGGAPGASGSGAGLGGNG
jgi:Domain of unknown function (DUF1942)